MIHQPDLLDNAGKYEQGPAAQFLADLYGGITTGNVALSCLPNERKGQHELARLRTRDLRAVDRFVESHDAQGAGIFFGPATVRLDAKDRKKTSLAEIVVSHVDIDGKSIAMPLADALEVLTALPCPPTKVNHSGHGYHAFWAHTAPTPADADSIRLQEARNRALADLLGGDHGAADVGHLLRLPGSHNSKSGGWRTVETVADAGRRYDPAELDAMIRITGRALIPRRPELAPARKPRQHSAAAPPRRKRAPPASVFGDYACGRR